MSILLAKNNRVALERLYGNLFMALDQHDRENDTEYVETLKAYAMCNMSLEEDGKTSLRSLQHCAVSSERVENAAGKPAGGRGYGHRVQSRSHLLRGALESGVREILGRFTVR